MSKLAGIAVAVAVTVAGLAPAGATEHVTTRTEAKTFYGTTVLTVASSCLLDPAEPFVGGVCFEVDEGEIEVDFTTSSTGPIKTGGSSYFYGFAGNFIEDSLELFCGGAKRVIPPGAATFIVAADVVAGPVICLRDGGVNPVTTVTATFVKPIDG